jgi:hypothetical protein
MSPSRFDYWRERAREARAQASLLDPGAARAMLDLARAYDRMAVRIRPKGPRLGRPSQSGEPVLPTEERFLHPSIKCPPRHPVASTSGRRPSGPGSSPSKAGPRNSRVAYRRPSTLRPGSSQPE